MGSTQQEKGQLLDALGPLVGTSCGKLAGGTNRDGILVFRGIPFAKPPIGSLRFSDPQPPEAWDGVREAKRFGHACPQGMNPLEYLFPMSITDTSEDCLYLNVWTPGTDAEKRPVMVWIHGGGFVTGSGSQPLFDGTNLAKRGDVVVVTLNYRLGIFGFLHGKTLCGEHLSTSGNEGILDQITALKWVHSEIESFGGDPRNVTVFGQSAGAICIAVLLAMPKARGLFHRAIMQSSGVSSQFITKEEASRLTRAILKEAGLSAAESGKLYDLSTQELLDIQNRVMFRDGFFFPVIDGEVLPKSTYDTIRNGETKDIPIMIGNTLDDNRIFDLMEPGIASMDEVSLYKRVEALVPSRAESAIQLYQQARSARGESLAPFDIWTAMQTDKGIRYPSMELAWLQAEKASNVFAYLFEWRFPGSPLGSYHGSDLPFIFGIDNDPKTSQAVREDPSSWKLSEMMQNAWLSFARQGNPTDITGPTWANYNYDERATQIFDSACRLELAPRDRELRFWEPVPENELVEQQ